MNIYWASVVSKSAPVEEKQKGLELVTELGGADPTGDSPPTACQEGEPWCGAAIEGGGEVGELLAWDGLRMQRMSWGRLRLGVWLAW